MELAFGSRKMQKLCNSEKEMRSKLGTRAMKVLQLRLTQIMAAENLDGKGSRGSVSRTDCGPKGATCRRFGPPAQAHLRAGPRSFAGKT